MNITFKPAPGDLAIVALFRPDGLHINGNVTPWDKAPEFIEYGEQAGVSLACDPTLGHTYSIVPSTWIDPTPSPAPDPVAEAQAALEAERQIMSAKKWQLRSVMGPDEWAVVEMLLTDPESILGFPLDDKAAWDLRCLIEDIDDIPRISETVDLLAYALRKSDDGVDDLFRMAAAKRK